MRIDAFLAFYRDAFPQATVLPKMHMLEDHVIPFLKKWKVGLGFLGEQGAESVHARFNSQKLCEHSKQVETIGGHNERAFLPNMS